MGAGASILRGSLIGVEVHGGVFGYTIDFPPGYFDDVEDEPLSEVDTSVPSESLTDISSGDEPLP